MSEEPAVSHSVFCTIMKAAAKRERERGEREGEREREKI
jgi:hypothetical protein